MVLPSLPLEIRARIYNNLDDVSLAKDIPKVFWAIVPRFFRYLEIGQRLEGYPQSIQTNLVRLYPESGCFVEKLTIYPEMSSVDIITEFFKKTPKFLKLKHIQLRFSRVYRSFSTVSSLPYIDLLGEVIRTSDGLSRLSFHIQPSSKLVLAGGNNITRLDIGYCFPDGNRTSITLPPKLEILSLTSYALPFVLGLAPNLRVLIIKVDSLMSDFFSERLQIFLGRYPLLTSLGIIDSCEFRF